MAEYYPLLAKAVGSLPNSTPDTRRVVYERARKALIGQLRMLHPPVPDEDIERESVELDNAVARLERELANGQLPATAPQPSPPPAIAAAPPAAPPASPLPPLRPATPRSEGARAAGERVAPARAASVLPEASPRSAVTPRRPDIRPTVGADDGRIEAGRVEAGRVGDGRIGNGDPAAAGHSDAVAAPATAAPMPNAARPRTDGQRPIAPQPPRADGARRRAWIIPVGVGVIAVAVALAAYKLRDTRTTVGKAKPTEQAAQGDSGKIAERVGGPEAGSAGRAPSAAAGKEAAAPAPGNPEVPVAQRAALLIEAPDEPNKVKTFLGTVVWKINNIGAGAGDGVAVEADVDLPDDKMKAVVTFEKNTDASLPASHTIKVRFAMQPGSLSGDVQQISVPQLRQEDSPSGEALAGVTVPVVQNSFLVGLSPGNAETVNLKQLKEMQWIDVPMLLQSGKIAKLTFEKGPAGERDLDQAIAAWQKS